MDDFDVSLVDAIDLLSVVEAKTVIAEALAAAKAGEYICIRVRECGERHRLRGLDRISQEQYYTFREYGGTWKYSWAVNEVRDANARNYEKIV